MRACLLLAGLALLAAAVLITRPASAQPQVPALTGRVVDEAGILGDDTERRLTQMLADHEEATSNQVVVLTVATLDGEPIEDYALQVARSWALGQADRDNGVLLLVARDDRRMRIEVGYGLEGALPDVTASRIIRYELRPEFRAGDYDAGVLKGVQAILGAIEGTYEPPAVSSSGGSNEMPLFARLLFALMFVLMPMLTFFPSFLIAGQKGNLFFISLFFVVGMGIVFFSLWGALAGVVIYWVLVLVGEWMFRRQEGWREEREEVREALRENKGRRVEVDLAGFTFTAGGITSGGGSGGSSGGFGGGGGGGFSGGGGSFGGGGASGGW